MPILSLPCKRQVKKDNGSRPVRPGTGAVLFRTGAGEMMNGARNRVDGVDVILRFQDFIRNGNGIIHYKYHYHRI